MSEILHKEYKADDVSVFAVHPGSVVTAMTSMVPEGRRQILIDSPALIHSFGWRKSEEAG